jgi:penicillin-binding protein 1A
MTRARRRQPMTDDDRPGYSRAASADRIAKVLTPVPTRPQKRGMFGRRKSKRRIRWLRLLALLVPLSFLAVVSTVFGMVLAFAPQIGPLASQLETQYKTSLNSIIYSSDGHQIGILTDKNRFFVKPELVPPIMSDAIVAIEDKRFYTEPGVDYKGIARAFIADVFHTGGGTQGGSTITEQFVKNALGEATSRTVFNKLKEAALAFQLHHLWTPQQILAEYLNTSYFGNGAYGVEAAARAYFGNDPSSNLYQCGIKPNNANAATLCLSGLTADEAALLAGLVESPSVYGYDLFVNPAVVYERRNRVLKDMLEQGYLTPTEYEQDIQVSLPNPQYVQSPSESDTDRSAGYFDRWVEQQLLNNPKYNKTIYTGGYAVKTTLDYRLQESAQAIVEHTLPPGVGGPAAALVAIDNKTGEVRAMVGGYNFAHNQFNLATEAERQPGSAFKVFDLAAALDAGKSPNFLVLSAPFTYTGQLNPFGAFTVHNDEKSYFGTKIPLWEALAYSDNSVFARLGDQILGEETVKEHAHSFGISTTISTNPAMVIGGLAVGVTPLDMAHAFETIANGGVLTSGTLADNGCAGGDPKALSWEETAPLPNTCPGPVGIASIAKNGKTIDTNAPRNTPVFAYSHDTAEIAMMQDVIKFGTGTAAQIPGVTEWGKTGTTSNYADAWFVGSIKGFGSVPGMTVAVWVGYPNSNRSMKKDFGGKPVYGGTYPAIIWKNYVEAAIQAYEHPLLAPAKTSTSPVGTSGSTTPTGTTGDTGTANTTGPTGTTNNAGTSPQTNRTPATGTLTNGGGSTAPANTTPNTGTTTPPPSTGATTPSTGTTTPPTTTTPPSTGSGGGVTAPGGGAVAPAA